MKQHHPGVRLLLAFVAVSMAALACSLAANVEPTRQVIWTPAPVTAAPTAVSLALPTVAAATPSAAAARLPTAPAPTWVAPTPFPVVILDLPKPTPAPTLDPHHVVITERDIAQAIAEGAAENNGARVSNPIVRFSGGKTYITADQVTYGLVTVQNLNVVGRLAARNGALQMETESVSPGGLVGAMIPTVINQAFKQYTSQWYVEDVQTLEGRIELRIR